LDETEVTSLEEVVELLPTTTTVVVDDEPTPLLEAPIQLVEEPAWIVTAAVKN